MMVKLRFGFCLFFIALCHAKTAEEWKSRIIYQILTDRFSHTGDNPNTTCSNLSTYCGGTFKGIEQQLDYIQGLGANAIWISPTVENTINGYHGYWAKNIYEVNPEFGTKEELKNLITECHNRDIWVMFDVVANHMGRNHGCGDRTCPLPKLLNYTGFVPFDKPEHYHEFCFINNYRNQTQTELCRLGTLPDLNQTVPYVRETLLNWIANLTKEYDVDGLRIDTLCEVEKPFWREFQNASGVYCLGEANNGDRPKYLADYQGAALEAVLNFPLYWALRKVFNSKQPMTVLRDSLNQQRELFIDTTVLGLFVDNHDFQRFFNMTPDAAMLRNALTYIMFGQGIPIVYYGTEQMFHGGNDPDNRESLWPYFDTNSDIYQFIKKLTEERKSSDVKFGQLNQKEVYTDTDTLVITRGEKQQIVVAVTNTGTSNNSVQKSITNLTDAMDGTVYENVFNSSDRISIEDGVMNVTLKNGEPKIYKIKPAPTTLTPPASMATQTSLQFILVVISVLYHITTL